MSSDALIRLLGAILDHLVAITATLPEHLAAPLIEIGSDLAESLYRLERARTSEGAHA